MSVIIRRCDNWGEPIGVLPYLTFVHEEDLDGTDMLTVTTTGWANKRDRLLWMDVNHVWHEHIVDAAVTERQNGVLVTTLTCSNSISELFGMVYASTNYSGSYFAGVDGHLSTFVLGTQWKVRGSDIFNAVDMELWSKSKRQCISEVCDLLGGELVTDVRVADGRVVARNVGIVHKRGDQTAKRYFSWGKNASSLRREIAADEVYTQIYGVGAPIEVDSSNYPVRYESVVSNTSTMADYGMVHRIPDQGHEDEMGEDGNYAYYHDERGHFTMIYVDDSLDSTEKLQAACERQLNVVGQPLVNYTFEFTDMEGDGMAGLSLGDAVMVRDEQMGLTATKRITHVTRTYYGRADTGRECSASMRVVVGERKNAMFEQIEAQEKVGQWVTGNHVDVNARDSLSTKGKYDRGGSGSGGGGGGDGVAHTLDGVAITGTVAFTSASGS